ncbi:Elongator complex protein 6-like protein [Drosera capensis]
MDRNSSLLDAALGLDYRSEQSAIAGEDNGNPADGRLMELYGKIQSAVEAVSSDHLKNCVIIIDDLSLLEVATTGASNDVLIFLHYCHTLPAELDCRLVVLNHEDIYAELGRLLLLQIEYLTDILIKRNRWPQVWLLMCMDS